MRTVTDHGPALARTDRRIARAADQALVAIARAYGVSLSDLFDGVD